jgi:hypothetical protein
MPHKYNADRCRRISKRRYKVTNWRAYEAGLRQRGSLAIWFTEAGVTEPPFLDWFHIAMRLQHATTVGGSLPVDTPEQEQVKTVLVAEVIPKPPSYDL